MAPIATEGLVQIDGRDFYAIPDVDRMPPFLLSIVSDGDRWMFVSSTGALTAGRVDASGALFPYETDDRLHASAGAIGPVTRIRTAAAGPAVVWRPFADAPDPGVRRTLAKSVVGDSVAFEEHHGELGLRFGYRWNSTERHGFVRTSTLTNDGTEPVRLDVLDGLVGVLPHGLEPAVYQRLSNLSHAYKRSELIDPATRLAVYSLEAPVSDRAEPEEVLRASTVWSLAGDDATVTLDANAVRSFGEGSAAPAASLVTGRPGAYLLRRELELAPGEAATWRIVADVGRDQFDIVELRERLSSRVGVDEELEDAIRATVDELVGVAARGDASQCTSDPVTCAHHVANVTYNVMRGGVPLSSYRIEVGDLAAFVAQRNRVVAKRHAELFDGLPEAVERRDLLRRVDDLGDVHLLRLVREYLPFSFSRRHGDPSRPWNAFSIRIRDDDGTPLTRYEGNWRDIFQNWEALCVSFPEYLPSVVTTFVNASTADGNNPYRITRDGIDWEVPDPGDPWSNIGYWGDHQLIYLLRLLEATDRFLPGEVASLLAKRWFTYADVPYRISAYDDVVANPKATITFDGAAHDRSGQRVAALGGDGKLLTGADDELVVVTMLEKLLVAALAKLANFVPGGGIWMNTQRPEWNDANNALAGYGLSVVTLCHLRQFLSHLGAVVEAAGVEPPVSVEVASWLEHTATALRETPVEAPRDDEDRHRKAVMDRLGRAASEYRLGVYGQGFSGATVAVDASTVREFCDLAIDHLDATIQLSRRSDGLVHSYNLVGFSADASAASVSHLPEMLEGQVAVLGSGVLDPEQEAALLDALFASALHRSDQGSFMLAPVRHLPGFVDKNVIPDDDVDANELLAELAAAGEASIVGRDLEGRVRFRPHMTNEPAVAAALDRLAGDERWRALVERDRAATLETYERTFAHHAFLGRSAAMYAYEGIGSIYWHMVTKLLVAVHDAATAAAVRGASPDVVGRLVAAYEHVRAGLGFNKTAAEFGAIPTDPYSHTPAHAGAQQPGMTGAVKEELLVRPSELGVRFDDGEVVFDPLLLRRSELLESPTGWTIVTEKGESVVIGLEPGTLGLTVCQVPVVVSVTADDPCIEIDFSDGRTTRRDGTRLGREISAMVFGRTDEVARIRAFLPEII